MVGRPWVSPVRDAVSVAAAGTTVVDTISVPEGAERLWYEVYTSDHKLDAFDISVKASEHSDSQFFIIANATSDFTTNITSPVLGAYTDPVLLDSDTHSLIWMDVRALYQVRIRASASDVAATGMYSYWQFR